jgi:hypothetical protein
VSNPLPPQSGKHHRGSPLPPKPRPTDPLINPEVARELYKKLEEAEVKLPIIHNTYHIDSLEKLTQPAYSVPVWRRITTRSVNLGGLPLPAGAKLFLWIAASGRDTSVFPNPEIFDLRRTNATKALVFGKGIHYCLGATLGKLEAQLALEALIERFPRLRLVAGKEISFPADMCFRGPQELWVQAA